MADIFICRVLSLHWIQLMLTLLMNSNGLLRIILWFSSLCYLWLTSHATYLSLSPFLENLLIYNEGPCIITSMSLVWIVFFFWVVIAFWINAFRKLLNNYHKSKLSHSFWIPCVALENLDDYVANSVHILSN